jgi:hypothetical protein
MHLNLFIQGGGLAAQGFAISFDLAHFFIAKLIGNCDFFLGIIHVLVSGLESSSSLIFQNMLQRRFVAPPWCPHCDLVPALLLTVPLRHKGALHSAQFRLANGLAGRGLSERYTPGTPVGTVALSSLRPNVSQSIREWPKLMVNPFGVNVQPNKWG